MVNAILNFIQNEWMDLIYIAIIVVWSVLVYKRHIDRRIRLLFILMGAFLVFFIFLKMLRYTIYKDWADDILRMIWYMYYISLLTVPLIMYYVSTIMNREYGFGKMKSNLYFIPVLLLLILGFLTNDYHELAFKFPTVDKNSMGEYEHGILYYIAFIWISAFLIATFVLIVKTCSISPRRRYLWIVLVPPVLFLLYSIIYINYGEFLHFGKFHIRLAETYCLMVVVMWECVMRVGFLPYKDSFSRKDSKHVNGVSFMMSPWTKRISTLLNDSEEESFSEYLADATVYAAFVKRCGNLFLLSEESDKISILELYFSVSESIEYLKLKGIKGKVCWEDDKRDVMLPVKSVISAYSFFEKKIEDAYLELDEVAVFIGGAGIPHMRIEIFGIETVYDVALDKGDGKLSSGMRKVYDRFLSDNEIANASDNKDLIDAKLRLHDEMGTALILARRYLNSPDDDVKMQLLDAWKKCFLLLQDETDDLEYDPFKAVLQAAADVGVEVIFVGDSDISHDKKRLIALAIGECVTNTFRHADGNTVYVNFDKDLVTVTNNGRPPKEEIVMTGGLKTLREKLKANGVDMLVESLPEFKLKLIFNS
ncbi:MAG: hypothetical protein K5656_07805 [Lachnospiraceae bacterium]|nr:hypothetical protein [Lachnospiraceae bacterium]